VTSPQPSSGVTSLCEQLAAVASMTGMRTLLLDMTGRAEETIPTSVWQPGLGNAGQSITRDPAGLISNIPALGTTLMGVLTGHWLRSGREKTAIIFRLILFGGLAVGTGLVWNSWFPINKNLWTSSFVLFSGGLSLTTLAVLYWALEIKQWRRFWTMPILVFGMNAIAGFVADALVWGPGYSFTAKGQNGTQIPWHEFANERLLGLGMNAANTSLLYSLGAILVCWVLLWLLWRKRIFLKV